MTNQITANASSARDLWKMAQALSGSDLLPKHFQGRVANCFLALQMSDRLGLDFFSVAQNLYVVHGTPAFSGKYLIALANQFGPFRGSLNFTPTGAGKTLAVECWAIHDQTSERVSVTVSFEQAMKAGWTKNAKYQEIPQQMLSYRAATFLVRLYCPEVTLGVRTVDEVQDIAAADGEVYDVDPKPQVKNLDPLRLALGEDDDGGGGERAETSDDAVVRDEGDAAPASTEHEEEGASPLF